MLKSLYSDDLIEFKDNNKWIKGNLKDIILGEKKFILSLEKENEKTFEHTSETLLLNNLNYESILKNENETYSMNQSVEFFDESSNSWIEGTIKSIKNDFYLISYITKKSINNSTILHKNNIRPLISNDDILKLNLHNAQCFSLKNFESFSNPVKYAKKFIKNLINLLGEKIFFVFLNNNFDLFIFSKGHENESKHSINEEIINGLINVAIQHFEEIDKVDKQLFK
jgi:hypothetical protein